jgi:hypothetical protein
MEWMYATQTVEKNFYSLLILQGFKLVCLNLFDISNLV